MRLALPLFAAAALLAGCSTLQTHLEPKTDLARLTHVFVQQNLNDNHGLDLMIVRELQARGLKAESGPMTLMPQEAEAYLTYQDQWQGDFRSHLFALGLTVRNARTDAILASTSYIRPTSFLSSSSKMVHLTVTALFSQKPAAAEKPAEPAKDRR